jgi:hypothetical protein
VAAFDYTTSAAVFAYGASAGASTDPVNEATVMAGLITGMSRAIDAYCNQAFSAQAYADQALRAVVDQEGVLTCYPPVPTMAQPTAASYRRGASSSWVSLDAALLDVEDNAFGCVVRTLDQSFLSMRGGRLLMRLSYTGGWANLAAVPGDFEWAMRALSWWAYQKRTAPTDPTVTEFGQLVVPGNWPPHIKGMFRNYVRQVMM